ncbi:MAG: hypothetical protein WB987_03335 [Candidatus Acidiferrales bacterium]
MSIRKFAGVIAGILMTVAWLAPLARAQEMNEGTRVTLREAIRIPGQVLPAGSYIFERANGGNAPNLNLIQIYNSDHTRLIATIETITAERQVMTGGTVMKFAEESNGQPPALMTWFYPGMREGHEFVYAPKTEQTLEAAKADFVVSTSKGAKVVADAAGD